MLPDILTALGERKLSKKNKIKGKMEFVIDNRAKTDVEIEEA